MAPSVIDLTLSSPEPEDESPNKIFKSFLPRKGRAFSTNRNASNQAAAHGYMQGIVKNEEHDHIDLQTPSAESDETWTGSGSGQLIREWENEEPHSAQRNSQVEVQRQERIHRAERFYEQRTFASTGRTKPAVTSRHHARPLQENLSDAVEHSDEWRRVGGEGYKTIDQSSAGAVQPASPLQMSRQERTEESSISASESIPDDSHVRPTHLHTSSFKRPSTLANGTDKLDYSSKRLRTRENSVGFARKTLFRWSPEEDALLEGLHRTQLSWEQMVPYFHSRTAGAIQQRYYSVVATFQSARLNVSKSLPQPTHAQQAATLRAAPAPSPSAGATLIRHSTDSNFGMQYSPEEDALLKRLKEVDKLTWNEILGHFNGRSLGSLQTRYCTKVKNSSRPVQSHRQDSRPTARRLQSSDSQDQSTLSKPKRVRSGHAPAATDGFVSWSAAQHLIRDGGVESEKLEGTSSEASFGLYLWKQDRSLPRSAQSLLRHRELGTSAGGRSWASSKLVVPEELKNHVFNDYRLRRYYHGTSGDVVGLSWSADGKTFAAGSIAITDNRSMQYNMSRNLLLGDNDRGELWELNDHNVPRPVIREADNVNALGAMQASQDPRLFLTVTATAFSPTTQEHVSLYTTGADKMLRRYTVDKGVATERYHVEHSASVDLLAMHPTGVVATGCHSSSNNIRVFKLDDAECAFTGSPKYSNVETRAAIYPSALKWGQAHAHQRYLLAGFCGDEDKHVAGETALWDLETEQQIPLSAVTRNVFDLAWNPLPSSTSIAFSIATNAMGVNVDKGMRTAIQCFAPQSGRVKRVLTLGCPALDINDLLMCPHDDHLIAAGATDGKVYIWDQRWIGVYQQPWHVLEHDESLNVLAHDRDREQTDTGVRFLSWGATKSRLYSGSSDGIVKVWNPYRSAENCLVSDMDAPKQHRSAIMSGAFSPDYRELLVGTENGRINAFSVGGSDAVYKPQQFKLYTAGTPAQDEPFVAARDLVATGKIVSRPCGAMPVRQAVQGPNYDGPFMAPSQEEVRLAEMRLRNVCVAKEEAMVRRAQDSNSDYREDLVKENSRISDAQTLLADLRNRFEFAEMSRPKAEAFQASLRKAGEERKLTVDSALIRFGDNIENCTLPCGFKSNPDGVEDSGRSELRIPGILASTSREAVAFDRLCATTEALNTCSSCNPLQRACKGSKQQVCLSCRLKNLRLTTACSKCFAPARMGSNAREQPLCEGCSFACFRCSKSVEMGEDASIISCKPCGLTWEAGILGYEIINSSSAGAERGFKALEHDELEEYDDFGLLERERLASRFEVEQDELHTTY